MNAMLCQFCGTSNPLGRELCIRCGNKLLVVSGIVNDDGELSEEAFLEAQDELEEHIIERISNLEDSVRQLSKALASTAEHIAQIEHNLTVTHAGVQTLGGLLETQGVLSRTEVVEGWERTVGQEMLSRDLARRFAERSQRILSQAIHAGQASEEFRSGLRALELALLSPSTDAAARLLTDLAQLAPSNDELWSFIGEAAFETGDLQSAKVAFGRVLELRGDHFETLIYQGTVSSDLGDWDEAEQILKRAREIKPDAFLPLFTLGALAVLRGDHPTAVRRLEAALQREEVPQALYLLGVAQLELGHTGLAIRELRRAVARVPDFEDALYQLGIAYLRRGWHRLALDTFQQVLSLDPQCLQYQETVRVLSLGRPAGLAPASLKLVERAEQAMEGGRTEAAFELYGAAIADEPQRPELIATAALLASALRRPREAVRYAHRLLQRPDDSTPYQAAAVVALLESLRQAGRPRAARRLARSLYRNGTDPLARSMAAYELAIVESELGDNLDGARELAREALEITPKELRHYPLAALGAIALKRGRYREAIQYLEQATSAGPAPTLLRQLAVARLGTGDAEGAADALRAADDQSSVGLDEELLGHVRRLGSLLDELKSIAQPSRVANPRGR